LQRVKRSAVQVRCQGVARLPKANAKRQRIASVSSSVGGIVAKSA